MGKKQQFKLSFSYVKHIVGHVLWTNRSKWGKTGIILASVLVMLVSCAYGVAYWYQQKHADEPLVIGTTFVQNYAEYLGVDPEETMDAMINDLGITRFRLVSYWKDHEKQPDQYDFSRLDWQFDKIEEAGGEISLAIGLRQPRWPECHGPQWAMDKPMEEWTEDLIEYMGVVIDRYKDREVLVEYQLENEFFLSVFGECPDFTRERLVREYDFVKERDPTRPVIVSRSNNALGFPIGEPRADKTAFTVYKRVWDKTITKRYFEYPLPSWFYGFLAGGSELLTDTEVFIHELQTEAWLPEPTRDQGFSMIDAPIEELYKSLSPERLVDRLQYAVDSGVRTIDVWGVEWWYQMKENRGAPEIWENAKRTLDTYR